MKSINFTRQAKN